MSGHPVLGDFSTILQFSVGANLTFATILSLFDNPLSKEKRAFERLEESSEALRDPDLNTEEREAKSKVKSLRAELNGFANHLEGITYRWFRPLAAASGLAALALLISATYFYEWVPLIYFHVSVFATVAPLVVFSIYAFVRTTMKIAQLERDREHISDLLSSALDRRQPIAHPAE